MTFTVAELLEAGACSAQCLCAATEVRGRYGLNCTCICRGEYHGKLAHTPVRPTIRVAVLTPVSQIQSRAFSFSEIADQREALIKGAGMTVDQMRHAHATHRLSHGRRKMLERIDRLDAEASARVAHLLGRRCPYCGPMSDSTSAANGSSESTARK